jgi:hypothetical protein
MSELYEGSADRRYGSAPAASVLVRLTETGQRLETVRISNDPEYVRLERFWSGLTWSGSGAGIGPELSETFLNSSQWSRRDLRIVCLSCSSHCVGLGVKGSQVQILSSRRRDGVVSFDGAPPRRRFYLRKLCCRPRVGGMS